MNAPPPTTVAQQAQAAAKSMVNEITGRLEYLTRIVANESTRYQEASLCGAKLAAVVCEFLQDPSAVGMDALQEAYSEFMSRRAGNFWPLADQPAEPVLVRRHWSSPLAGTSSTAHG